jgi:hypothetical protein
LLDEGTRGPHNLGVDAETSQLDTHAIEFVLKADQLTLELDSFASNRAKPSRFEHGFAGEL